MLTINITEIRVKNSNTTINYIIVSILREKHKDS